MFDCPAEKFNRDCGIPYHCKKNRTSCDQYHSNMEELHHTEDSFCKIERLYCDHEFQKAQYVKTIEELSELQKEICKALLKMYVRECVDKSNIEEEVADVEIMLRQIKTLFGLSEKNIESIKVQKLEKFEKKWFPRTI